MGFLVELVAEFLLEIFGEILIELGISGFRNVFDRPVRHPFLSSVGYLFLGLAIGAFSLLLWPERVTRAMVFPGASLFVGPLVAGTMMHFWGEFRRGRGRVTSGLASFYGGAAFAFGVALARFASTQYDLLG